MTLSITFAILGLLAIVALVWCFRGFSRELRRGRKTVGLVVRIETAASRSKTARDRGSVIEIPRQAALHRPA